MQILYRTVSAVLSQPAFNGCSSLSLLSIPAATEYISEGAFEGCTGVTSFNVDEANPNDFGLQAQFYYVSYTFSHDYLVILLQNIRITIQENATDYY